MCAPKRYLDTNFSLWRISDVTQHCNKSEITCAGLRYVHAYTLKVCAIRHGLLAEGVCACAGGCTALGREPAGH